MRDMVTTDSRLLPENKTPPVFDPLLKSFERHLKAERKDPDTVSHYVGASAQFLTWARERNLPPLTGISREHVEWWLEELHEQYRPHTVRNRYIGLRIFFKWLHGEGEIDRNPMARIRPPSVEESPKDVVRPEDMVRVFTMLDKAKNWRDAAMIAILYDTGMRASEVADLRRDQINLDTGVIFIPKSKTNRVRTVRLSPSGVRYVDRYLRRPRPEPEYLFNGPRGRMTRSGIYGVVRKAFEAAGVPGIIGAHDLRHTSASHVAASGEMAESDAMMLYGWTDPEMWRHYTGQARQQAALAAHAKASPLERLGKR